MENTDITEYSEIIQNLLESYLKPKVFNILDKIGEKFNKKKELITHDLIESKFQKYLEFKVTNFLIIDTLVFPNYQTLIKTLYEPLFIKTQYQNIGEVLIDQYPSDLFNNLFRILIQDTAGMGKSTLSRIMFLDAVNKSEGIPFHIELRKINSTNSIIDEVCKQLNLFDDPENEIEFVKELIGKGEFIFILDGYDEVAFEDREKVSGFINQLLTIGDSCKFCLTSRPEAGLASFGDFISFEISELTRDQAYSIFRRLDTYAHKPIASDLISAIEENERGNNENKLEFLGNPLLVSLLYKTFDFKKNLPDNLSQFYRQIYDALFENHDLSKEGYFKREKFTKLHIDDFEKILRCIGFQTSILGKNEYNKDQLIQLIEKANKFFPDIKFRPSDFVKDITSTVPLFKKEGFSFKWSHKSLQDYFGAKFLYSDFHDKREQTLLKFLNESSNAFLLKIYNSLDSKTFRNVCLKSFLDKYVTYCESQFESFKDSMTKENTQTWIDFSFNNELKFIYVQPDNFDLKSLKSLRNTKSGSKKNLAARESWYNFLKLITDEINVQLTNQSIFEDFGRSGPLCDKYVYQMKFTSNHYNNVLVDIYPDLFNTKTSEKTAQSLLCKTIAKLEQSRLYNILNIEDKELILDDFQEINNFMSLFGEIDNLICVNYKVALKFQKEIDEEIRNAQILDYLF